MKFSHCLPLIYVTLAVTHGEEASTKKSEVERKWGFDWAYSGISTFAHLPHVRCLTEPDVDFDIAIIGAPFDTAVSYRPGARFGPRAIRSASARQVRFRAFNTRAGINPYNSWAKLIDCGDIPVVPFDNALAINQMTEAFVELGSRSASRSPDTSKPRLVTLGGDHSIALPALRALREIYQQPIAVLHFDAHLDTWDPAKYPSAWNSEQMKLNHGSMFWKAALEGLIMNGSSVHAGLRTRLSGTGWDDYQDDSDQGFLQISTDDIDDIGTSGIIEKVITRIGTETPTYLSVDIDVLDPGIAPGTGTPEPAGWTTREIVRILRGIESLNVVGADMVEVSPSYDGVGESTSLAAAQIVYEIITSLVKKGVRQDDRSAQRNVKDEL